MKISIITCVLNNQRFIEDSIKSFENQDYQNKEHVIIDGGSSDNTVEIVEKFRKKNLIFFSSRDNGIYDALNKGINFSSGNIIGILHSDDFFENKNVISNVIEVFKNTDADLVYGDLVYVSKNKQNKIRHWQAGEFFEKNIKKGWMPPHPAVFVKKKIFDRIGNYNTDYKISSDYDFLIRALIDRSIKKKYIQKTLVNMRIGGVSNKSIFNLIKKTFEDFRIIKKNKVGGLLTLFNKNYSKINQFFHN